MRYTNDDRSYAQYLKSFEGLGILSRRTNIKPLELSTMILDERRNELNSYVKNAGLNPERDLRKLAIQTTLIHQNRVAKKIRETGLPLEKAEILVFRDEAVKSYTGAESFAPALLAVASSVGGAGIKAINDKRSQTGKKPILSGKFWASLKDKLKGVTLAQTEGGGLNIDIAGKASTGTKTELGAGLDAAQEELIRQGKKSWFLENKYLLIAIIAAVIIGGYFLLKRK